MNYAFVADTLSRSSNDGLAIDVGAGERQFRDLLTRYHQCLSVDFYPYDSVDVVCDLSRGLPLRSDIAGVVLMSNVFEHMKEPESTLRECFRLLRRGGSLVMTVPFMLKTHQAPHDFFRYTNHGLEYLLGKTGFSQVAITPIGDMFDVHDSLNVTTDRLLKRIRNPLSRLMARTLFGAACLSTRLLAKAGRGVMADTPYALALPMGFGCTATK